MSENGAFPFGRPNDERPARMVRGASATVIGVYPSAWHVTWTAPPALFDDAERRRRDRRRAYEYCVQGDGLAYHETTFKPGDPGVATLSR